MAVRIYNSLWKKDFVSHATIERTNSKGMRLQEILKVH